MLRSANVCRVLGAGLLVLGCLVLIPSAVLAWAQVDDGITKDTSFAAAVSYPVYVVAVLLIGTGSALQWGRDRSWPPVLPWASRSLGIGALISGVLMMVVAGMTLVIFRSSGAPYAARFFATGGITALIGVGALALESRVSERPRQDLLAVALIVTVVTFVALPDVFGVDLVGAAKAFARATPLPSKPS